MAEFMPLVSGILTACAIWFSIDGPSEWNSGDRHGGREACALLVGRLCAAIGSALPAPLRAQPLMEAAAREMARGAASRGWIPDLDDAAASGLILLAMGVGGLMGAFISQSALGAAVGAAMVPLYGAVRAARRKRDGAQLLATAMPEAFHALAISLGSGHSLAQALRFVGNHAQEPVHSEFMRASFAMACGVAAPEALDGLLRRLPAPGLDLVALALKVSQRTGAPLRDLLAQASDMVGERVELARRLEVKTAQARMSARLVTLMPVVLIAVLTLLSADFRKGVTSPTGGVAVAVALVLDVTAWLIIKRVMEVEL